MHSSRMRTARSLPFGGSPSQRPPRTETPPDRDHPGTETTAWDRDPPKRDHPGTETTPWDRDPPWTETPLDM